MEIPSSILAAAAAIGRGSLTPSSLVRGCLARIEQFESRISAWALVDAEGALQTASALEKELATGRSRGPLHGIPIAIKDIVDVAGKPTRAGATITDDKPVQDDATVVARLRAAGCIILGKTVTTEFASFDPPPTRNPWNAASTPGGSSSGSAAAPALDMCLGAIGSQTGGSITRPASYCGIAGMKPTFGRVSRAGVVPLAFHLDHVGTMARNAADCAVLFAAINGPDARDPACSDRPACALPDPLERLTPPRLGVVRRFFFEIAQPDVAERTDEALRKLAAAGAEIVELPLPDHFDDVIVMHRRLMAGEAADYHRAAYGFPRGGYGPRVAALLNEGLTLSMADYQAALRHQNAFRHAMGRALAGVDAIVVPSTVDGAPDKQTTGDPRFNAPWSHAGIPTVSIPCALTQAGLPLSLQLLGSHWSDAALLQTAVWCEKRVEFSARPPLLAERA